MTSAVPASLSDASAIDQYLHAIAAPWLKAAPPATLALLRRSLEQHRQAQKQVAKLLGRLPVLDGFAKQLLAPALQAQFGITIDLDTAVWREKRARFEPALFPVTELVLPTPAAVEETSSLLQRAMQNFSVAEGEDAKHFSGTGIVLNGVVLAAKPSGFARLCHMLNIGGQYQRELNALLPEQGSLSSQSALQVLAANHRLGLQAQAHCSRLQGAIDERTYRALLRVCEGRTDIFLDAGAQVLHVKTLCLQACEVLGALVFEASDSPIATMGGLAQVHQVVIYLPGDPYSPLRSFTSRTEARAALKGLLGEPEWCRYFLGLLGVEDRQRFVAQVLPSLNTSPLSLDCTVIEPPVFLALAYQQIRRIKADAAVLAVPSAVVEQRAYRERMQRFKAVGRTLAEMAVSFLPGVGELMLLSMARQLIEHVYEGVHDWTHGQREQALDHLFDVLESVAVTAAVGAVGVTAVKLLKRRPFIDKLVPVQLEQGGRRLWNQDLTPYQATQLPAAATLRSDGLRSTGDRYWLQQQSRLFEVIADARTGRWRIRHPERAEAYAPYLEHNGHGAWLMPGEHPLQWDSLQALIQRQAPQGAHLSEADCQDIALIARVDQGQLRSLLVNNQVPPASLQDTLQRFNLNARVGAFVARLHSTVAGNMLDLELYHQACELFAPGEALLANRETLLRQNLPQRAGQLFERMCSLHEPTLGRAGQALQQAFAQLPVTYVHSLVEAAGARARAALLAGSKIPLALTEQASLALRNARLCNALLGLRLQYDYNADSVRLVFALLRRLPHWPRGLNFELREGSAYGRLVDRLLAPGDARETRILLQGAEGFEVLAQDGSEFDDLSPAADFVQAITDSLSPTQRRMLGWQGNVAPVRRQLFEQAVALLPQLDRLIGLRARPLAFRPPQRQLGGRIGYALSGRGAPARASLSGIVRELFPGMEANEVEAFLQRQGEAGGNVMVALTQLQHTFAELDAQLTQWSAGASGHARRVRERVTQILRRCWRRQSERVYETDGSLAGYRLRINDIYLDDLPTLPAGIDFSHVVDVNLAGTGLTLGACAMLSRFSNARWLDLSDCRLTDIPESLLCMNALSALQLQNNQIRLSPLGAQRLGSLSRLRSLNLDGNPLGERLELTEMDELHEVMLRATGLAGLPEGLLSRPLLELADLRDNQLTELPDSFYAAPARVRVGIVLHDNPLSARTLARIGGLGASRGHLSVEEGRRVWLASSPSEHRVQRDNRWESLMAEPNSGDFFRLLADMTQTAEFQRARGDLERRVWSMLEAAHESTALRHELFTLAANPTTCIDSVISVFSGLEVRFQLFLLRTRTQAQNLGRDLLAFARRLFRLEQVERLASREISSRRASGRDVDEVEVSLAYRTGLARELDLPGQPRHMQFVEIAAVSERDLAATKQAVEVAELSEQLGAFIGACDFWVDYLREQHGREFAAVEDDFWARLERVMALQDSLTEGDYLSQMNQLAKDRDQALQALALRLTHEALAREPG